MEQNTRKSQSPFLKFPRDKISKNRLKLGTYPRLIVYLSDLTIVMRIINYETLGPLSLFTQ